MKISLYIFLSLICLYLSQNIITSWNYDKVAMYDLQKINVVLSNFITEPMSIPLTLGNSTLKVENINLLQIQTNLYDSLINYNTGLLLLAPNKITLSFNFSYTYEDQTSSSNLELKILTFKLRVTNDKLKEKKTNFEIKMNAVLEGYSISGIKNSNLLTALKILFCQGLTENSILTELIPNKIEEALNQYYTEFYKSKKNIEIKTRDFFGENIINIKNNEFIYFCEDLLGEYKTAFCYYKGNVDNVEGDNEDKTETALKNERFSHNEDDLYNLFINNDLVGYGMDYIVKNYFEKNAKIYNNKTNTKELSYDFTVNSLNNYFRGLEYLNKGDYFDCEIYIEKGNLNEVTYKVKVNIRNENKDYFEMRITSGLTTEVSIIKSVRFNLCLKQTSTKKVEIIFSTTKPQVEVSDLEGLKKAIEESFDFSVNPICLNNEGISLKDYFAEITKAYVKEEGIYFEGPQLYQ